MNLGLFVLIVLVCSCISVLDGLSESSLPVRELLDSSGTTDYNAIDNTAYMYRKGVSLFPTYSIGVSGGSAKITCVATPRDHVNSIHWKINGVPVHSSSSYKITKTPSSETSDQMVSVLTVSSLTTDDEGRLECSAIIDDTWYTSRHGVLKVLSVKGPSVDINAMTGVPTSFYCFIDGHNFIPIIQWYKNNRKLNIKSSNVFSSDDDHYTSVLKLDNPTRTDEGVYKCKATWDSNDQLIGGTIESDPVRLSVHGVIFITQNTEVKKDIPFSIQCTVNNYQNADVVWKKDGIDLENSGYTIQTSGLYLSDIKKIKTSKIGRSTYSCAAKYTNSDGIVGYSAFQSMNLTVYQTCPILLNPTGGTLVCKGNDSTKNCSIRCNRGYVGGKNLNFLCVNGNWNTTPSSAECTAITEPSLHTMSYEAVYQLTIPCFESWGPYILAAYPYFLEMGTNITHHNDDPEVIQLDYDSFECVNYPHDCSSSSDCKNIGIHFAYTQKVSLNNDKLLNTLKKAEIYIKNNAFNVMDLLNRNNRLDSSGKLVGNNRSRHKRFKIVYDGPEFHMNPEDINADGTKESIECPEFTVTMNGYCTICGHGWFVEDKKCAPCPIGTYQEAIEPNKCKQCPEGFSTVSTASTSLLMCTKVCRVTKPRYGSVHPPEYSLLPIPSNVDVLCNKGFVLSSGEQRGSVACSKDVECTRIELVDTPEFIIRDSSLSFTCVIEARAKFESCHLIEENSVVNTVNVALDNDRQICKFSTISVTKTTVLSCSASNNVTELLSIKKEITLLKPSVTPSQVTLETFKTINLACTAVAPSGYSMIVWWKKHGHVVSSKTYFGNYLGLKMHTIVKAQLTDSGSYTCEVNYMGVGISESIPVPVKVIGFLDGLSDFTLYQGQSITVSCTFPFEGSESFAKWYKDGENYLNHGSGLSEGHNQIIKSKLIIKESGVYQCRITSDGLNLISEAKVSATDANHRFIIYPESQYASLGSSVTFHCKFSDESAKIHWLLDDEEIEIDDHESHKFVLANPDKDVIVQCLAILPPGDKFYSMKARAIVRRFLTYPLSSVLFDEAVFHCSVYGPGLSGLIWKNSKDILQEISKTAQLTPMEFYSTLITSIPEKYRCIASFEDGEFLESQLVETLSYSVSITDEFALMKQGFQAKCKVSASEAPVAIIWKINADTLFEDDDVFYDGYQGYSEASYYFTALTDRQIGELQCSAVFGDNFLQVTSPKKSLAPLGITRSPVSLRFIKNQNLLSVEIVCEFYDYSEVDAVVTWESDDLIHLGEEINYVSSNIAQATLSLQASTLGAYDVKCSVDYGKYGSVVSDSAEILILQSPSLDITSPIVGYGNIAEVTSVIPRVTDDVAYEFSINRVIVEGECLSENDSYITSRLKWPLMLDTDVILTVSDNKLISTKTAFIKAYGIEYLHITGPVNIGASVDLSCIISKEPTPDAVFWYFKSQKLLPTLVDWSGTKNLKSVLSLHDIKLSMYGLYACAAKYNELPSVYEHISVIPSGACLLPLVPNGLFSVTYMSSGSSTRPSCSEGFVLSHENQAVLCKDGDLIGELPQCLYVGKEKDSLSLMVTLIVCACVTMTCFTTLSFIYCFKTHSKAKVRILRFFNLIKFFILFKLNKT